MKVFAGIFLLLCSITQSIFCQSSFAPTGLKANLLEGVKINVVSAHQENWILMEENSVQPEHPTRETQTYLIPETPKTAANYLPFDFQTPPVKLASFNAQAEKRFIELKWMLTTDKPIGYFKLQRAQTPDSWEDISPIMLAPPQPDRLVEYRYTDRKPYPGSNYYRLKQVEKTGHVEYSDVIVVERFEEGFHITNMYPHPAIFGTTIDLHLKQATDVSITLQRVRGKKVAGVYGQQTQIGKHSIEIDMNDIPAGTYYCEIKAGSSVSRRKIVK